MFAKLLLGLLWIGFGIYAFGFAPPQQPDTWTLIQHLSTGNYAGINPLIIALFNIMGVWPLLYCCILFADGRGQRIPVWPFALASFAVGAFALLPYAGLRQANPMFSGQKDGLLRLCDSRWTGAILLIATIALLTYGVTQGNWSDFVAQWQTSRFIHVMSLDFCALCLLFPVLLSDDMARRGLKDARLFWVLSLVPLLGPAAYVALRPPLEEATVAASGSLQQS